MSVLREAVPAERPALGDLAFAAKAHWGYPAAWLELWRDDLQVPADAFGDWDILVVEESGTLVGSVWTRFENASEAEIEGLWVHPTAMRRGHGRRLLREAAERARHRGARTLRIVSDPHALEFYVRLGARRIGESPSRPAGRTLPVLVLSL